MCKLKGLNLLSMVLILAAEYNECALKIDFFGIPGDSLGSYKEAFTLQCEISGNSWSNHYHYIIISQKNKDGTFDILDTGNSPIMKLRFKDVRCKHSQEFICEVRSLGVVKIWKTFVAAQRECPLEFCPLEGYANGEKSFTVALFESLQFKVCFQSPSGTPPKVLEVIPDAGNDSRTSKTTLRTSQHSRTFRTFQTKVSKKADVISGYLVEVKAITIQPDDLGLWKMSVVDGADKDERNPIFLSFRVNAQGPPQCPLEVNVTKQTNSSITVTWLPGHDGGAPQHFIVFYSQNSSADDRKWHKHTVTFPSNSRYVSSTIKNLHADTGFLFRVAAVNTFNADTVNFSDCEENSVMAKTFAIHQEVDSKKPNQNTENLESQNSMLHIIIGVSVPAFIFLMIVVIISLIFRNRVSGHKIAITKQTSDAKNAAEWLSCDQGYGGTRERETEMLFINTADGLVRHVARNRDDPNPGSTPYANWISVPNGNSKMDCGGTDTIHKKQIALPQQMKRPVEGTEYANLDVTTPNAKVKQKPRTD